jgi:hypothetical protein
MCGELGFKVEPDPEDPGLCRVVLDIGGGEEPVRSGVLRDRYR